ncbi:MAG: valine--tRNA ligase [Candidatus Cloacimonetes bacterium]|nr:valine--tRNA ligase [Candidatus Cloacimonadota bacterium]
MEINKVYEPQNIEKKWYTFWQEQGFFTPRIDKNKKPFTVLIPPPNVTGILHMGHVLNNTLQDVAIRYHRMKQEPTLWIPGTDHAGIATQNMVEKDLAKEGLNRHQVGREELVKRIWKWKADKGGHIIQQLKQLGASCDWSRERFTMDEGLSRSVKEVFIHLYKKNLIYKGKYIINWCPRCVTALANDEVEYSDEKGKLWHIRYPYQDGSGYLVVATTRPETMLGDVAVAVHPKDERYINLVGKNVILPIANRAIPVIADDYVDREFGTGCVKITPAHDPNDFEVGNRHHLTPMTIMDEHGFMNELAGANFNGLDRFSCRKKIVSLLEEQNLLDQIDNHDHSVGHCYRCDTVIEPYLSDQWFVRMKPLAERAIDVVQNGQISFYPERWTKVYMHWMNNIRDWCISRQIWWGHRIPAYYCNDCNEMVVSSDMPDICPKCGNHEFTQDEDVLDTWFSSWLWPFSTMGWPTETDDLKYFLPTNLLITAPEIIYLWVARMIMATLEFKNTIPFDTVLLHGTVRDESGRKMSKSLGNSPDPIDIINEFGADALRFSMIFNTPKGQDSYYSDAILESGRNFCNKIWNAFRFIMMNVNNIEGLPDENNLRLELSDRWIYSRLNQVIRDVTDYYENLRFNDAASIIQEFVWKEFCSWYLELTKERAYNSEERKDQQTVKYILLDVLQQSMRLLHPIMPFITEEIFQTIKEFFPINEEAVIIAKFPVCIESMIDEKVDSEMSFIQESIVAIRNLRKQVNLSPALEVRVIFKTIDQETADLAVKYRPYFFKQAKVAELISSTTVDKPKSSLAAVVKNAEIYLPLEGLIDVEQEKFRLEKQLDKISKELSKIESKLNNDKFKTNAPTEIYEKEKEKYQTENLKYTALQKMIEELA